MITSLESFVMAATGLTFMITETCVTMTNALRDHILIRVHAVIVVMTTANSVTVPEIV